jgi:hypothetical protein
MYYRGSSRHLLKNSKSALLAAIEIYNKPSFSYREESFVILLLNAWELLLKAIISKNAESIYYPKKRKEAYRTLSVTDSFAKAEKSFPKNIQALPLRNNLGLLTTYRDNAVHFYNEPRFGVLIYSLSQTSVINFKDLLLEIFGKNLAEDISWQLMPLGLRPPVDPITYLSENKIAKSPQDSAVNQFINTLASSVKEVEDAGADTARLMTAFNVSFQSVKKIESADLIVGVNGSENRTGPLLITKIQDPNVTHPLRRKKILEQITELNGRKFTTHVFQAICYKFKLQENSLYCWKSTEGLLTKYSHEVINKIKSLNSKEVEDALSEYKNRAQKSKRVV